MSAISDDLDTDAVAAAVRGCPGVSAIASVAAPDDVDPDDPDGSPGRGPGPGPLTISYDENAIDISVIAFYGHRPAEITAQIEQVTRPLIGTRRLTVTIEDLDTGHGHSGAPEPAGAPGDPMTTPPNGPVDPAGPRTPRHRGGRRQGDTPS